MTAVRGAFRAQRAGPRFGLLDMVAEVAEDLKAIFKVRREKTAPTLAEDSSSSTAGVLRRRFRSSRQAEGTRSPTYITPEATT